MEITASGLCQRFTATVAQFLQRLLQRLTQVRLPGEAAPIRLLKRFSAVIVEDSTHIHLPDVLAEVWRGCGGSHNSSQATLKLFVRWNVLSGELQGPLLTDGRQADAKSPFKEQEVPAAGSTWLIRVSLSRGGCGGGINAQKASRGALPSCACP